MIQSDYECALSRHDAEFQRHFEEELNVPSVEKPMTAYEAMVPFWPQRKMQHYSYERDSDPVDRRLKPAQVSEVDETLATVRA